MPIRFQCVHCSARMRVPDGSEGRRIRCPRCGHTQHVPEESLPPLPAFPSADDSVAGTMAMSEAVPPTPVAPAPADERPEASPVAPQAAPPPVEPESVVAPPSDVPTEPAASSITEDAEKQFDEAPSPVAATEGVPPSMTEPVHPPLQSPPSPLPQSVGPGDLPAAESKSANEPPPERGGAPSLASEEPELSVGPVVAAAGGHLAAPVVGEALAIVTASVAGRPHPTPMPHVEPRPRDVGALPPSATATPGTTPHAIPLSSHPSAYRPPPRPMPQGVDASMPMVAPAPPYPMLMLAGWMLRSLAVLAVVVSVVSVFMAVRHMGMARPMAMLLFMGGLSMGVLLLAAGEAVIAFRDMVRNSYRR